MRHENAKDHLSRFVIKLSIAALIAGILKRDNQLFEQQNYLSVFSLWIFAYAAFAVLYAVLRKERLSRGCFTYWDQAMWLGATAVMVKLMSHVV